MSWFSKIVDWFYRTPAPKTKSGEPLPPMTEKAIDADTASLIVSTSGRESYTTNPDLLIQKKGIGVYDYMLNDDQIAANSQFKKIVCLGREYTVSPASPSAIDEKIAAFVRWNLTDHLSTSIREVIYSILTAMDYGYSVSEKVWEYYTEGDWKGLVGYKNIHTKDPRGFRFDRDEFGNLKPDGLLQNTEELSYCAGNNQNIENVRKQPRFPVDKFVIFSYMAKFQNPYGTSDLRAGYRSWISKDILMKLWSMYLERHGAPIPNCEVPNGADPDEIDKMKDILQSLQTRSCFTFPEGYKPGYMESVRTAAPGFERAIGNHNGALSRSSLVPDLLGFSGAGAGGGSYGLGKTQYDVFIMLEEFIGLVIEEVVFQKQIIKPLVDMNFRNVKQYPTMKFSSIKRETRRDRAQILNVLATTGILTEFQPWMVPFVDLPIPFSQLPKAGTPLVSPWMPEEKTAEGEEAPPSKPSATKPVTPKLNPKDPNRDNRKSDPTERTITDDTNPNVKKD